MILENVSKKTEELYNEVIRALKVIETAKQVVHVSMNSTRNYFMRLNLHISLAALTVGLGAGIGSVFGMNLVRFVIIDRCTGFL